jgi:DNA-binding GntR family transcriptional regulator
MGVRTAVVSTRVIRNEATLGSVDGIVNHLGIVNNTLMPQADRTALAADRAGGGAAERRRRASPRRQVVLDALREAIVVGRYEDGERLIEDRIARELKTSRGPVREALRQLEHEGLVVSYPYRGAVVLGVSDEEVHNVLIPIRLTLERFSFTKARERMGDEEFGELAKEVWLMGEAARENDLLRIVEADIRFHEFVLSCSGQPHTTQVWRSIAPRIRAYFFRYGRNSDLERISKEHEELLTALRSGNERRLMRALETHIVVATPSPA